MPSSSTKPTIHPLQQIAESPSHKLLLKQWLKEEELISRRLSLKESRIDSIRRQIAALYCAFFVLHSLLLLLLLLHSASSARACRRSWIPCLTSLSLSTSLVWAVRYKSDGEDRLSRLLHREEEDSLLLAKCVEELKKKGAEFDLSKEVDALRRAKSLRREATGEKVRKWSARDSGLLSLFAASCVVLGLTRFVLCSS